MWVVRLYSSSALSFLSSALSFLRPDTNMQHKIGGLGAALCLTLSCHHRRIYGGGTITFFRQDNHEKECNEK